jgi:hypothetical protein
MTTLKQARWLALAAGSMDFATGIGLVLAPRPVLALMGAAAPADEAMVYLRWVGAFVGAVGASYLLALVRGGTERLRAVLEFTILFRLAAGGYCAAALALGWLPAVWVSVPAADLALAAAQGWLLRKGGLDHG